MRVWTYSAAISAIFLAGLLGTPALAQTIGSVIELNRDAYGTPPGGQTARLDLGASVVSDELVQTLAEAATRIRFLDESDLRVGESLMIVLDRLIYRPDQGTGEFVFGIRGTDISANWNVRHRPGREAGVEPRYCGTCCMTAASI